MPEPSEPLVDPVYHLDPDRFDWSTASVSLEDSRHDLRST